MLNSDGCSCPTDVVKLCASNQLLLSHDAEQGSYVCSALPEKLSTAVETASVSYSG